MKRTIVITLSICLVFSALIGQVGIDSQLDAWRKFNEEYDGKWIIRWNENTGVPRTIYGSKTKSYSQLNDPEQIARLFLVENRTIFRMKQDLSDLSVLRQLKANEVHVIDFQQFYIGVKVFGGEYSVAIGHDKAVQMVSGQYYPDINVSIEPDIKRDEVFRIALSNADLNETSVTYSSVELVIFPHNNRYVLAYDVSLNQWRVFVDAATGSLILKTERIATEGNVYPRDPVNSSLTTVPLYSLLETTRLRGRYTISTNAELGDAYSPSSDFRYYPPSYTQHDETHFNDVNVYHHVWKFAVDYWAQLGEQAPYQVNASVHDPGFVGHDNASADWSTLTLTFGHGILKFWDSAKQDDFIYHEYAHIVDGKIGLEYTYEEERAMHEGYSDYHAASFTEDSRIGDWVTRCTDVGALRNVVNSSTVFHRKNINNLQYAWCSSTSSYLNFAGSAHANSMIWSGALWDLRNLIGTSTANFLVYQGLVYKHTSGTTFLDGREGILIADQNFYNGSYASTINNVFNARGIGVIPSLQVTITGPTEVFHAEKNQPPNSYTWTASASGGSSPYTYRWFKGSQSVGTGTSYTESYSYSGEGGGSIQFTLRAEVWDAGTNYGTASHIVTEYFSGGAFRKAPDVEDAISSYPDDFTLTQNYPNPFNPVTKISFGLPELSFVRIGVLDLLGREILTLANQQYPPGYYDVTWKGIDGAGNKVGSGIYFYRITVVGQSGREFSKVMKMIVMK